MGERASENAVGLAAPGVVAVYIHVYIRNLVPGPTSVVSIVGGEREPVLLKKIIANQAEVMVREQ